jgi:DHA2 family multidrug resistance protein
MFGFGKKSIRGSAISQIPSLHHEHSSYRWWVLANVMIGTFMAVLDATIVDVALPKIMATFGINVDEVKWVATAYLLVVAVMLPTSGWIADHFGYKKTYSFSLFLFTFGSLLCSLSWNESALIIFRIIQGAGAGLMMPVGLAIVTREFPPEKRGLALGFWSIAAAASVSLGPTMGGYLIDNFAWHSIFDVNVPIGVFGILATILIQREYKTDKKKPFDFLGFVSVSVFLSFLLIALSDGNSAWNTGGWTSGFILTCFGLSLIGFVVFLVVEYNIKFPLIELRLLNEFDSVYFRYGNVRKHIYSAALFAKWTRIHSIPKWFTFFADWSNTRIYGTDCRENVGQDKSENSCSLRNHASFIESAE